MVPEHPAGTAAWDLVLAVVGHWGIYLLMLIASILGWTLAGTFGTPQDAQLFGFIPVPAIASNANSPLHGQLGELHIVSLWTLAGLVVIHVAATFYHQYVKKNKLLQRML